MENLRGWRVLRCMSNKHDFGNGPVAAHRHTNPDGSIGGWVADTADVGEDAYVGKNAWVYDHAKIHNGASLHGTTEFGGNSVVFSSAAIYCSTPRKI